MKIPVSGQSIPKRVYIYRSETGRQTRILFWATGQSEHWQHFRTLSRIKKIQFVPLPEYPNFSTPKKQPRVAAGLLRLKVLSNTYGHAPAQAAAEHVLPFEELYFQAVIPVYFLDLRVAQIITESISGAVHVALAPVNVIAA